MSEFDKILIIGFDGLDKRKIEKYSCDNLQMKSFGLLDQEGLDLKTPQLWASFITGERPERHGIDRMLEFEGEKPKKYDQILRSALEKFGKNGLKLREMLWYYIFDAGYKVPDRTDLKIDSVFEKVADSKSLDVPGYNEYPYIAGQIDLGKVGMKNNPVSKERMTRDIEAEFLYRKKQLFENIGKYTLLMQHLHYPDFFQHMYVDEEKNRQLYERMDDVAREIQERVDEKTMLVFCSDHGLDERGHSEYAFYSVNAAIEEPVKITNLLEKCLEQVTYTEKDNIVKDLEI